jgi:transposase-like protein
MYRNCIGITEEEKSVILGFQTIPNEGSLSWQSFLESLTERGIGDSKIFITDGLQGMLEAIKIFSIGFTTKVFSSYSTTYI